MASSPRMMVATIFSSITPTSIKKVFGPYVKVRKSNLNRGRDAKAPRPPTSTRSKSFSVSKRTESSIQNPTFGWGFFYVLCPLPQPPLHSLPHRKHPTFRPKLVDFACSSRHLVKRVMRLHLQNMARQNRSYSERPRSHGCLLQDGSTGNENEDLFVLASRKTPVPSPLRGPAARPLRLS